MARTKEPVDVTPGTKTKEASISTLKGVELASPLMFSATWEVPSIDDVVSLLSNPETANSVIEEIASARMANAMAEARAKVIADNEPREVRIERFMKKAMAFGGVSEEAARAFAEANVQ